MNQAFEHISPFSWRSLQMRLALSSAVMLLVSVLALMLLVEYRLQSDLARRLGQQQLATVNLFAKEIDGGLQERMQSLEQSALPLGNYLSRDLPKLQSALEANTSLLGLFSGGIYITNAKGAVVASAPLAAQRSGQLYRDGDDRKDAALWGKVFVAPPEVDRSYGEPVVAIHAPIRDARGQVLGRLSGVINLARPNFMGRVFGLPHGETGNYYLIANASHKVVSSSDPMHLLRDLGSITDNPDLIRFLSGASGIARMDDLRGKPSLGAATQIPSAGWTLLATLPLAEAFAPANSLTNAMLLAGAGLLAVVLAFNIWMARRQLSPAFAAAQIMVRHAQDGQALEPLPIVRFDEIGQLIQGINHMLAALKARDSTLEASEVALQKSSGVLREAQQLARLGNWSLDIPSGTLHWSEELFRIFEFDPDRESATYARFLNAVHPEDRDQVREAYIRSLRDRRHYQIEHRLLLADGRIKWVQERALTEFDPQGTAIRSSGTVQDITDRKLAEAALADSNDLLRNIIESVPMRIFWKDRALNYVGCNTLFARDSGLLSPHAIIGKSDYQMGWADLAELYQADDNEVIASGRTKPFYEEELQSANGQKMWIRTAKVPLHDKRGNVTGVLGVYYDITAEKMLSMELEHHHNNLEEQVRQRTAELESARQLADQANRAKSEFLANMSHEIRTPMNGVIGMVDVLQHSTLNAKQKRMVATIQQSSMDLLNIVNDVLDFSKIEAGKLHLEILPTQLRELARTCASLMQDIADKRGVQIGIEVDAAVPDHVSTDPTRVRQIVLNLLSNAIKFSPAKGGRADVYLGVSPDSHREKRLVLQVRDNGIGIEASALEQLFQPFTQADASTMRRFGGTGLGLSITQRLVSMLGGDISVNSSPGKGSCFTVQWPLVPCTAHAASQAPDAFAEVLQPPAGPAPSVEEARKTGRLILVVEDNEINRDVISQQLSLLGYASESAADGLEALEMLDKDSYALLLTDCHMPRMDGFALAQTVRSKEQGGTQHLPIIAVTANALQGEAQRCRAHGMDDYLSKPLRMPQLAAMLQRWLPGTGMPLVTEPTESAPANPDLDTDFRTLPVFDEQALPQLIGPNTSMHHRLLVKFLSTLQTQHAVVNTAIDNRDSEALETGAHTLKSAARSVGAAALGALCFALETAARECNAAAYPELIEEFNLAVAAARRAVDTQIAQFEAASR
jgi:PAS domain S-box-containing protein